MLKVKFEMDAVLFKDLLAVLFESHEIAVITATADALTFDIIDGGHTAMQHHELPRASFVSYQTDAIGSIEIDIKQMFEYAKGALGRKRKRQGTVVVSIDGSLDEKGEMFTVKYSLAFRRGTYTYEQHNRKFYTQYSFDREEFSERTLSQMLDLINKKITATIRGLSRVTLSDVADAMQAASDVVVLAVKEGNVSLDTWDEHKRSVAPTDEVRFVFTFPADSIENCDGKASGYYSTYLLKTISKVKLFDTFTLRFGDNLPLIIECQGKDDGANKDKALKATLMVAPRTEDHDEDDFDDLDEAEPANVPGATTI